MTKVKKKQSGKTILAASLNRMGDTRLRIHHRDITIVQALHNLSVEVEYVRRFVVPTLAELKVLKLTPHSRQELYSAHAITRHLFKGLKDQITELKEAVKEARKGRDPDPDELLKQLKQARWE